jgi:hypothetical protein
MEVVNLELVQEFTPIFEMFGRVESVRMMFNAVPQVN